jgi:serine/tyrosine/threonine adenylyltransferase
MKDQFSLPFVNHYATLPDALYSVVQSSPLLNPQLLHVSQSAMALVGLDPSMASSDSFLQWFNGDAPIPNSASAIATAYAGHQFGSYVPKLGDGRALLLGQIHNTKNELWEIQLKGSGQTPYSRFGDGRAVLRSSIREYLCSEAMHALGIPTTRAVCLIGSDTPVRRESMESAAMVTRLAPSFIRFGHFEFAAFTLEKPKLVKDLADHVIADHYPDHTNCYDTWFSEIVSRTAHLMALWQAVGFAHGVMNTDNFSILGLTIDYGPFGFMDDFDPEYICNHSDHTGRYAFNQQPRIGLWNLHVLAQALSSLLTDSQKKHGLDAYWPAFIASYHKQMSLKLGLEDLSQESDRLIAGVHELLVKHKLDYTQFFRALSHYANNEDPAHFSEFATQEMMNDDWFHHIRTAWKSAAGDKDARCKMMLSVNPKYVLRNYLAEQAIRQATLAKDFAEIDRLFQLLARPFDEQPEMHHYAGSPPAWADSLCINCSS